MNLNYLRSFQVVCLYKNLTRAAKELGYTQANISIHLKKLEEEFEIKLFERVGNNLVLTNKGEQLLKFTNQILNLYHFSKSEITIKRDNRLIIGATESMAAYYLPPYIEKLIQRYPELYIRIQTESEETLKKLVKEGTVDVAILLDNWTAESPENYITIREEILVLVTPPGHPLSEIDSLEIKHLNGQRLIMTEESCIYRKLLEQTLSDKNIKFDLTLSNIEAIKKCVIRGLGISVLPLLTITDEKDNGSLVAIPIIHPILRLQVKLAIHPNKSFYTHVNDFKLMLTGDV